MNTTDAIVSAIDALRRATPHIVVGISGYAGSGKSTLARRLVAAVDGSVRIRGDDFLDPQRTHRRSGDWDGVGRARLRDEVIDPFRSGQHGAFRRFDWNTGRLAEWESLPEADVLVIDCIGLFHPDLHGAFDLAIWVDLDLTSAAQRGRARDRHLGRDHDSLWDEIWVPNERDFAVRFDPMRFAHLVYDARAGS